MAVLLEAACLCSVGRVRKNNEDNLYFDGRCLPEANRGLKHPISCVFTLQKEVCAAVFDGMGGENFGESASFAAATALKRFLQQSREAAPPETFLEDLCIALNEAVLDRARELRTSHMGSTMVALWFSQGRVWVCSLGDSRAYRLREGEFLQLSEDHVEKREGRKKAPLTQHLGIDPEEFLIEPFVAGGEPLRGDQYLLCSDGLTDMLTDPEIEAIMTPTEDVGECAGALVRAALEKGGRDNVTVIVCRVK